ncbi:hypothetical protein AB4559_10745 [Vibrio sp. 10N.222.51.C8]|uniref:hypothetical protein n=1 Tax=Vibrio TaxID=662 RepID=UPI000C833F35|nr:MULTISPECIES: hypothetical protein [unclassified Vibrio]PMK28038.1 hypothetical protein BCU05_21055 [Vibrio sp. 10N.261.54.C3]PML76884.1 hypothetical protein BCT71_21495 [Vibrio sp. 10N.261.51.A7]PMO01236.1 hypothetical protein BCT21_09225 [Vibrio sp. 10N.222.55.F9]PMO03519.1 hypothetical protein BCT20_08245 [Vibrio sp. 10N.222.55.C12]PMO18091.1 hypothetical protein BCT17_05255 [Vibrio sp. 10N.222.54.F10]
MNILYFDPRSLLYSSNYLNQNDDVRRIYELQPFLSNTDLLMKNVTPDRKGAQRLADAANSVGFLLYPTGERFTRELLIKHTVFTENQLAAFVDLTYKVRLDDRDPVRLMLAHANALNATWFICGDVATDDRLKAFTGKALLSAINEGVSDSLISQINKLSHI